MIPLDPMDGIEVPKLTKKAPRMVEKGGVGKLLERARETRLYPLILLGLATGARRGELLALQWPDIDHETGLMSLTKSLEQTKAGSQGQVREVREAAPALCAGCGARRASRASRSAGPGSGHVRVRLPGE
jgi:integrase